MRSKNQIIAVALLGALLTGCGGTTDEETPAATESSSSSVVSQPSSVSSVAVSSVSSSSTASSVATEEETAPPVEVTDQNYDHCTEGFKPHETDGTISTEGWVHERNGIQDVAVDPTVLDYMYENGWQDAHVLWHQARTCSSLGGFGSASINGLPSACDFPELLPTQNDCEGDENGLDFLAGHSIMMYQLRELWPSHLPSFSGWESFPRNKEDFPAPIQDRFKGWSAEILAAADIGDNIEDNIDMFPSEGALGTWISCAIMPGASETIGESTGGFGGFGNGADFSINRNLHFALHDQAAPPALNDKHSVNNTNNNLDSFMFWKLHSWIDHVWMRYRAAKNVPNSDQILEDVMVAQCREMDAWREISVEARGEAGHPNNQDDEETYVEIAEGGFFHENVRPAFIRACTQCHGEGGEAGLQLGGQISSTEVVEQLLRPSNNAADWQLVVPGDPEASWLYQKASGGSEAANPTCIISGCQSPMPGLTDEELENLRIWIENGAELPIIL